MPAAGSAEVARLNSAFERMLDRLEAERSRTAGLVLRGQEEERARIARDLHDEANQALTAVLLRLQATAQQAPPELRDELRETQAVGHPGDGGALRLARELRPVALDDHGLAAALRTKVDAFARRACLQAELRLDPAAVDALDDDAQIAVYRVVQEGLSNVARHAGAAHVLVEVAREGPETVVRDRATTAPASTPGAGDRRHRPGGHARARRPGRRPGRRALRAAAAGRRSSCGSAATPVPARGS